MEYGLLVKNVFLWLDKDGEEVRNILMKKLRKDDIHVSLIKSEIEWRTYKDDKSFLLTDNEKYLDLAISNKMAAAFYWNLERGPCPATKSKWIIEGANEINGMFLDRLFRRKHKIPWVIRETKRCIIREIVLEDVPLLYNIYEGEGITEFMEPLFENMEDEIAYTKAYIESMYEFYQYGMWIVEKKEGGEVIGRVGLEHREGYEELELGYIIGREYERKGYGREACRAAIQYAKEELECKALHCFIMEENIPSIKLCESLGFHYLENVYIEQGKKKEKMKRFYLDICREEKE